MKRPRTVDGQKIIMRRTTRKSRIGEGMCSGGLVYAKLLLAWALLVMADFLLGFRFEYLWPFWLLLRSIYDSFRYQGLAFSVFFVCVTVTSDLVCFLFIPVQWLFFLASTYVWVQYVWHADRGVCMPTVSLWLLFLYVEASVRLKDVSAVQRTVFPFTLDLCRPFAAHCIGYPVVTLGFGIKSYFGGWRLQRRQREVARENEIYGRLLTEALPATWYGPGTKAPTADVDHLQLTADEYAGISPSPEERISNGGGAVVCTKQPIWNGCSGNSSAPSAHWSSSGAVGVGAARRDGYRSSSSRGGGNGSWLTSLRERLGGLLGDRSLFRGNSPSSSGHASDDEDDDRDSSLDGHLPNKSSSTINSSSNSSANLITSSGLVAGSSNAKKGATGGRYSQSQSRARHRNRLNPMTSASSTSSSPSASSQPTQTKDVQNNFGANSNANNNSLTSAMLDSNHHNQYSCSNGTQSTVSMMDDVVAVTSNVAMTDNNNRALYDKDFALSLESDLEKLKTDLRASRSQEADLRGQLQQLLNVEKNSKSELLNTRQKNDQLETKLQNLLRSREQDKTAIQTLEKKLVEAQRQKAEMEKELAAEKKSKQKEEAAAARALAQASKLECSEACKQRRRELDGDVKQLRRDARMRDEQMQQLESELMALRQYKDAHNAEVLMSALSTMREKNSHLEQSLSAENRLKQDLFRALGDAKCQIENIQTQLRSRDYEIDDLRRKLTMKDVDVLKRQGMTPPPPAPIVNGQQQQQQQQQQQADNMELLTNALANVAAAAYMNHPYGSSFGASPSSSDLFIDGTSSSSADYVPSSTSGGGLGRLTFTPPRPNN